MNPRLSRLALPVLAAGLLLVAIFAAMVVRLRAELRAQIRQQIIDRAAEVLRPVAQRQLAAREAALAGRPAGPSDLLAAVLENAQQEDMLAMVVYDAQGRVLRSAPDTLLLGDLALDDYLRLLKGESISRYDPALPLDRYFAGVGGPAAQRQAPVLEVLLPLRSHDATTILGFAQYYIDARPLAGELAALDRRINGQTAVTLGTGALLIAAVLLATAFALRRAQRTLAERNERLVRANYELALAAKTSALGQITSHLLHGLQGSVAGLRAAVDSRGAPGAAAADWESVAAYTGRMQAMIHETVALLSDVSTPAAYELTGDELAEIVRRRNAPGAAQKGVALRVDGGFAATLDNHRGSLLCLVTSNLVQNAVEATAPGRRVTVTFAHGAGAVTVTIADEGHGIPPAIREHLFEPGRSGRPGGSGLGLAISQLLTRQIGATLALERTGPEGTAFRLTVPARGDKQTV
ncbi:MAG TPA: ATP-binding protein [Opitutaceae bacterium]|nr:ATP-binding protein [Opitutaceae bacterium]